MTLLATPMEPHAVFAGISPAPLTVPGIPEPVLIFGGFSLLVGALVPDGSGSASLGLPIPLDPTLIGVSVFFQDFGFATSQLVVGPAPAVTIR